MNEENMNEKFSIVIDINENYESYKEHAKSNKDEFKNKFVLFYTTWNDAGFYTLLVVRSFYENSNGKIIGTIRICHDDLVIDNENKELLKIRHFLEKDYNSKGKINVTAKLGDKYISTADSCLYDKLKEILIDDKVVIEFLSRLNEISTITDNERIEKIKSSKDWYKKSFIREIETSKIVAFTKYKNDIKIEDNSYYILKNLSKYFDKINIDGLYEWALNYDLSIEEAMQVFNFIKENHTKKIEQRNKVLKKFKDSYADTSGFIREICMILEITPEDYAAIENVIKILKVGSDELDNLAIGHYTRLDTIKILIKKKNNANNEDKGVHLRLTNGRQMNDPLEGKILLDYILDNNNLDEDLNLKKWDPTYWYISSATAEMDSLPMWKLYGGDAKGGMLVYDKDYLKLITENKVAEIYRVCYVDMVQDKIKIKFPENFEDKENRFRELEGNIEHLKDKIKELKKNIESFKEKIENSEGNIENLESKLKIEMDKLKSYILMLSDIAFLFKKDDYSYENEYRIVVNRAYNEKEIEEQDNPNYIFPFLYTYLKDIELKYSKVILGPKAVDIDYVAPYINYCDKDIEIERSSISYR